MGMISHLWAEGLPLYYWRKPNFQNFGDHVSLHIVERILGKSVQVYCKGEVADKRLLAVGSLLGAARENDVLWGTGMNGKLKLENYQFTNLDVRAVRGPLTRQFLSEHFQIEAPQIYGDPALLFPYLFPEFKRSETPSIDVLIIPHYSEEALFPKTSHNHIVYPSEPWDHVIRTILDSRFVISSSLHGVVIAEAYGIPARYLRVTEHEPMLKYQDYYLGTNRPNFRYATSVLEALHMHGEPPFECDLKTLYDAFPLDFWPGTQKREVDFINCIPFAPYESSLPPITIYPVDPSSSPDEEVEPVEAEPPIYDPSIPDLEAHPQEFILESKRIILPGYEYGFNPSLVRWKGSLLLSFRINDNKAEPTKRVGLVWLNDNYDPIGPVMVLDTPFSHSYLLSLQQDPRLITIDDHLYIVYNNIIDSIVNNKAIKRMFVAELEFNGKDFVVKTQDCIADFPGHNPKRWEKNWVPFVYDGKLLLSYSIFPHLTFEFLHGQNACGPFARSNAYCDWKWGDVRGGSQALPFGDQYLAFFHSSQHFTSVQSEGKHMLHYFMGAYTFSSEPPFRITSISPEPIVGKDFYNGPTYKTWKPLRVVFPGGFVFDGDYIWIAYGRQDNEIWVTKLDKEGLLNSLIPVSEKS